jgi:hypothetical protein
MINHFLITFAYHILGFWGFGVLGFWAEDQFVAVEL